MARDVSFRGKAYSGKGRTVGNAERRANFGKTKSMIHNEVGEEFY